MGPLTAVVGGQRIAGRALGSRKARTVLGLLAAMGDVHVPADRLVDAAWPEHPPARPGAELAILVSRLRSHARAPSRSPAAGAAYRLDRRLVQRRRRRGSPAGRRGREPRSAEPALAIAAAAGALAVLDRGEVVDDDPYAAWADEVRERVARLRRRAGSPSTEARCATQRRGERAAGGWPSSRSPTDPLDEEACRLLMRAAVALGEDAVALAAYERLRAGAVRGTRRRPLRRHPRPAPVGPAEQPAGQLRRPRRRRDTGAQRSSAGTASSPLLADAWRRTVAGEHHAGAGLRRAWHRQDDLGPARSAELAAGALVLQARCFEAERSLFLQPVVEAIGGVRRGPVHQR